MEQNKFYWLKLKKDFFKRHDTMLIENMPNGKDYIIFYLKLLCESVDHNGNLRFNEEIPYSVDMLSVITNTNVDIVKSAITLFTQLQLMEILDDGTYYMSKVESMMGSAVDNDNANRQRRYRAKQKEINITNNTQLLTNCKENLIENTNSVTKNNASVTHPVTKNNESKNIDIDKDIDKKENNNIDIIIKEKDFLSTPKPIEKVDYITLGTYQRIKLKVSDYERLKSEFNNDDLENLINRLDEYVEGNNNKNKYKNYNAVIRNAIREQWFKMVVRPKQEESDGFAGFEVIGNDEKKTFESERHFIVDMLRTDKQRLDALELLEKKQPQWANKIRKELGL